MAKKRRKRGHRFRKAVDAQDQYEQIEARQRQSRQGKLGTRIDSIEKSKQREKNAHKKIRDVGQAESEFDKN